jgi:hypothetical protein
MRLQMSVSPSATMGQWERNDAILDREALQGGFGGTLEQSSHAISLPVVQEIRWRHHLSKRLESPRASIQQREGV